MVGVSLGRSNKASCCVVIMVDAVVAEVRLFLELGVVASHNHFSLVCYHLLVLC